MASNWKDHRKNFVENIAALIASGDIPEDQVNGFACKGIARLLDEINSKAEDKGDFKGFTKKASLEFVLSNEVDKYGKRLTSGSIADTLLEKVIAGEIPAEKLPEAKVLVRKGTQKEITAFLEAI